MALNEFALNVKMPPQIYLKIVRTLHQNSETANSSIFNQELLLGELPSALKNEVLNITHRKILNSFAFFEDKPPQFILDIIPKFKHMLLTQDEALYRKGDWVEEGNIY